MRQIDTNPEAVSRLAEHARRMRCDVIRMLARAGSGHTAGSLGLADVMACLFGAVMRYNVNDPNDPGRDIFVLSNGHTCPIYYAALAEFGAIPAEELMTLRQYGSRLQGHPERTRLPWAETTSGPLGQGLSQAAGMAYALKYLLPPNDRRVYCIVGDGECDEGQIWEAAMFAGKYHLDNLVLIVDRNRIQLSGLTEQILPLEPMTVKWSSSGWRPYFADGNNIAELIQAFVEIDQANQSCSPDEQRPHVIIATTVPGKGVSFVENDYRWHGKVPTPEQAKQALTELGEMS